jgi:hypothetical protein
MPQHATSLPWFNYSGEVYELQMPGSYERGNEPSGFMLGFTCVAEQLLASEEEFTSVELIS